MLLTVSAHGRLRVLGVNPCAGDALGFQMGTDQGIYPWVSTLVMGNLMGRRFWVGRGCFSWGGGGGRESSRSWSAGSVAGRFKQTHFVIYYMLNSGGFSAGCLQVISKGVLDPRLPWTVHLCGSSFDNPSTCSTHEDSEGAPAPRSVTDSTEQWV